MSGGCGRRDRGTQKTHVCEPLEMGLYKPQTEVANNSTMSRLSDPGAISNVFTSIIGDNLYYTVFL
jgi:hypothetical protein